MRKHIVLLLSLLFLLSGNGAAAGTAPAQLDKNLGASARPDHVILTWTGDPKTTQTISWRALAEIQNGSLLYQEAGTASSTITAAAQVKLFRPAAGDKQGSFNLFSLTLSGLKPGTRYNYIPVAGETAGEEHSFMTEPSDEASFSFLLFGDSQSGKKDNPDYLPWQKTVSAARAANPDARFIMNAGDLVETGQDIRHWNSWMDAAAGVIASVPELPVEGNHETYNVSGGPSKPAYLTDFFPVFQNGPEDFMGQVYSFDYGNAHFSVIDSQKDEEAPKSEDFLKEQAAWLDKDLSSSVKTFKLVFFHKTPYFNKLKRGNEEIKAAFCPVAEKYHADIVFNGHDHCLARTYPVKDGKFFAKPEEGTVYYICGRSGAKFYTDSVIREGDEFFFNPKDQPCYVKVEVSKSSLTVKAFNADGTQLDNYTINK